MKLPPPGFAEPIPPPKYEPPKIPLRVWESSVRREECCPRNFYALEVAIDVLEVFFRLARAVKAGDQDAVAAALERIEFDQ